MKRLPTLVLMVVFLVACTGGWMWKPNCSRGGEVCVKIEVAEPIRWGEPVTVTITVVPSKDIPGLGVGLNYDRGVVVEGPQGWEVEARDGKIGELAASWYVDAQANTPLVFIRKVHLPLVERWFDLGAAVYRADLGYIVDPVSIYLTHEGGKVYYSGTPLPIITRLIDQTVITTPLPSFTPLPTRTPFPTPSPTPTHPRPSPPPTLTPAAYPSPITPIALPTIAPWGYP